MKSTSRGRKAANDRTRTPSRACSATCRPLTPGSPHAHCTVCHRTFSGVGHFDTHRVNGRCEVGKKTGLVEKDNLWSSPEGHAKRIAVASRLADGRQKRAES